MSFLLPALRATFIPRSASLSLAPLRAYSTPSTSSSTSATPKPSDDAPSSPRSSTIDSILSTLDSSSTLDTRPARERSRKASPAPPSASAAWKQTFGLNRPPPPPLPSTSKIYSPEYNWSKQTPVNYSLPVTPTSARSIAVKNGDVGRAFRVLNRVLRENDVRRELRRGERFEGPSDKRVRLDSERHRKRFKVAVGKKVGKAMRMKNL